MRPYIIALTALTGLFTSVGATQLPASAKLPDEHGRPIPLRQKGRVAVLIFSLRDCPISRRYAPEIGRLIRQFPDTMFRVVLVDPDATPTASRQFRHEFSLACPVLTDPKLRWPRTFRLTAVPTAMVFDRQGKVTYRGRIDDRFPTLGLEQATIKHHDLRDAIASTRANHHVEKPTQPVVGCTISLGQAGP